jgi:hypothetical protein
MSWRRFRTFLKNEAAKEYESPAKKSEELD